MTPPYMFLLPGNGPRSTSRVRSPARAATIAAHDPAGPPPTTITSKPTSAIRAPSEQDEQLVQHRVRVGGQGQVGELHHRAVAVGVDADDVGRRAEATGVLDGPADAEGEVQLWVDDDAGGADLAVVADPAPVGDDAGRADAGAERSAQRGE